MDTVVLDRPPHLPCDIFKAYAWSSVRVDKYYATVRIFARHYDALKTAFRAIPHRDQWPTDVSRLPGQARKFFIAASGGLNEMSMTGIFSDEPYSELANFPRDTVAYASVTCYCFQWNLFETFVVTHVLEAVHDGRIQPDVAERLRKAERKIGRFLAILNSGEVFGHSPFRTILPVEGWAPTFESCEFKDLEGIRIQRNSLVHAASERELLQGEYDKIESFYEHDMWVLRKFAENIENDVEALRTPQVIGD
jgi:hypothetical protein